MLYKRNEFEEIIPKDDLRVGMKFCTREIIRYGWAQDTGLTFYYSHVIQRITPKRTKVVCEDGFEFNTREADFYKVVPEMQAENEKVKLYRRMIRLTNDLEKLPATDFVSSGEEMREAVKHLYLFHEFVMKNKEAREQKESTRYGHSKEN